MQSIDDLIAKSLANQAQELHARNLELLLGQMVRSMGVHHVRKLLLDIAEDLKEFDRGQA